MREEAHRAVLPQQQQHLRLLAQLFPGIVDREFFGQLGSPEGPAFLLSFVHLGDTEAGGEQGTSAQAIGERAAIVVGGLAQLVDAVAPDLVREFVAHQRIVGLVLGRSDQHLVWIEIEVVFGSLVQDLTMVKGQAFAPRRSETLPA